MDEKVTSNKQKVTSNEQKLTNNIAANFIKNNKNCFFFHNLNTSIASNNTTIWKVIKPFFTNKPIFGRNIKLTEKEEILKDDTEIVEKLKLFLSNAVKSLNIAENTCITNRVSDIWCVAFSVNCRVEIYIYI